MFNFNARAKYNPMQTAEAARMGRADRRQIQQQNALAQAGKSYMDGDYKGAAGALMPYDMGAGIQMAQYGQQQAKTAETEQLRKMYEVTQLLAKEPDVMRRVQMAQEMSPGLGIPAPTNRSDYTDDVLQRELNEMRIKGGFELEAAEPAEITYGNTLKEAVDAEGNPVYLRTASDGTVAPVENFSPPTQSRELNQNLARTFTGQDGMLYNVYRDGSIENTGIPVLNNAQITDIGGVPAAVDRRTQEVTRLATPEEVGGNQAAGNTTVANEEDRRAAQQELPLIIQNAEQSISTIKQAIEHPGFDMRYGVSSFGGVRPAIPDTPEAAAQAFIDQIAGQAFLEAFESLKGGGHITEIEGDKATAARTRMLNQTQGAGAAREAALEFIGYIERGMERAKATAGGTYATPGPEAPVLVYNPETGDFD